MKDDQVTGDCSPLKALSRGSIQQSEFANPKSYLKDRRIAATNQRRSKILNLIDSSVGEVDYSLPDWSGEKSPIVPLSPRKKKNKNAKLKRKQSTRSSFTSCSGESSTHSYSTQTEEYSMEDVLRSLHSVESSNSDDTTCRTDLMSSSSFNFNHSIKYGGSSLTSLYGDEGECVPLNHQQTLESSSLGVDGEDKCNDAGSVEWEEETIQTLSDESSFYEEETIEGVSTEGSFYEEESIDDEQLESVEYHFEEVTLEDASLAESLYEEEIAGNFEEEILEEIVVDDDDSVFFDEEEVCSDDEDYFEEIIGDSSALEDEDEDSFVGQENSLKSQEEYEEFEDFSSVEDAERFESPLEIIDEADYESDLSRRCSSRTVTEEVFVDENNVEYVVEVEECTVEGEEGSLNDYFDEGNSYASYIEEEIIPNFEVPVIPAIVAWQEEQEAIAMESNKEPPEEAPRTPRELLMAVLAASAMEFKLRKVPEEHKNRYVPTTDLAASLGRLSKLKEHVIEAMGCAPAKKVEQDWAPTGGPITFHRSLAVRIATEAAAMGRVMRLQEVVISNYKEPTAVQRFFEAKQVNVDEMVDEYGHRIFRSSVLMPLHEQNIKEDVMSRNWNDEFLENSATLDTSIDDINLPTEKLPTFKKPSSCSPAAMTNQEIKDSIARGVAEKAWERRYRLDRPQKQLKIRSACQCQYCATASPFQTHAYKLRGQVAQQVSLSSE